MFYSNGPWSSWTWSFRASSAFLEVPVSHDLKYWKNLFLKKKVRPNFFFFLLLFVSQKDYSPPMLSKVQLLLPRVNFTNILRAAFAPISLYQKSTKLQCKCRKAALKPFVQKKLLVKCWWNWQLGRERQRKSLGLCIFYWNLFFFLKFFYVSWKIVVQHLIEMSGSQPRCRGTLGFSERLSEVPPVITFIDL